MLLHELFEDSARRLPEKVALTLGSRHHTYSEIAERAARLAAFLQQRGVKRGDRVATFVPNGFEFVTTLYAALRAGAVFMPISPLTKAGKLAFLLKDATPAVLLVDEALRAVWAEALAVAGTGTTVVVAGGGDAEGEGSSFAMATATDAALATAAETIDQDLAALIYTSGSTGEAKGVMLTHLNMVSAARSIWTYLGLVESDVILCALPLSFDYGLYQVLLAFARGARVVLHASFSFPVAVLQDVAREGITVFPGVPTMFATLLALESLPRFDLGRIRVVTNTAAALSERHIHGIRAAFPNARVFSMYGLTECKRVSYLPPEELERRPASVGRGMPNEEVYLVDGAGRRLPNGSVGELVVRGSNVMRGYWRKPAETAERLRPGPYPGELALHTGDVFRTDEEGFLYFVSRKDDIIKSRGEKVAPREVENALYALEGVQEAAVVGVPDPLLGEAVVAYLVLANGHAYTERAVVKHCLARLESFMAPKEVVFVASLPRTPTGKIDKTALKSRD